MSQQDPCFQSWLLSKKGICISERSCFALPLTVFSFYIKAGFLRRAAKGAERRRQEAGAAGFDHFSLCLFPSFAKSLFQNLKLIKTKRLSRGMQLGHAHTRVHSNLFKGKAGRIHPSQIKHFHQLIFPL